MPTPTGTKEEKCRMQRALFKSDPVYAAKWVKEYGDQCAGVSMAATKRISKNGRKSKK